MIVVAAAVDFLFYLFIVINARLYHASMYFEFPSLNVKNRNEILNLSLKSLD